MKRSRSIKLTLVPLFASVALACSKPVCVDKAGTVVNDAKCQAEEQRQQNQHGVAPFYYWYYYSGGSGGYRPSYGSRVGGSVSDYSIPGRSSFMGGSDTGGGGGESESGVSRGGFGESAVGHGIGE